MWDTRKAMYGSSSHGMASPDPAPNAEWSHGNWRAGERFLGRLNRTLDGLDNTVRPTFRHFVGFWGSLGPAKFPMKGRQVEEFARNG